MSNHQSTPEQAAAYSYGISAPTGSVPSYTSPYGVPYGAAAPATEPGYQQQNQRTHFISGLIAGAAFAYLLSNKNVQHGIASMGSKAWSTVRGEVEELKERLEDTQAELDYYRSQHKDK
ncbi:MAG: hypothetical protein R3Y10_11400 [Ferrimonas sp.]